MNKKLKKILLLIGSISGIILIITGIVLMCTNFPGSGIINIKSIIISGEINSDSIGLILIFLGVILQLLVIIKSSFKTKNIVYRKKGEDEEYLYEEESGDPYVDLIDAIFPNDQIPLKYKNLLIDDWLTQDNIKLIVDEYILDNLFKMNVDNYFNTKEVIFSEWNKNPVCSPPIHHELEKWLKSIKEDWINKLKKINTSH